MEIPTSFYCPISRQIMTDPVITNLGISYDKKSIIEWLTIHNTCPVTNQTLTLDMLNPNRALQDTIEQMKVFASGITPTKLSLDESSLGISSLYNGNELLISITPSNGITREPAEICLVIDTSGSMGVNVTLKNDSGSSETYNIDILDLVKNATKTIINVMETYDVLSIVGYSSEAHVILEKCPMTLEGKAKATKLIESLQPSGQTNLWDGLHKGLETISDVENKNTTIFLLTDGQPNIVPPRGHIPMLNRYMDDHKNMSCNINTFAFGYSADSPLLVNIAAEGNGSYNFIPDSGFVGTVFVHSLANFLTTKFNRVNLKIELDESIDKSKIDIPYKHIKTTWGIDIDIGSIRHGQTKDIIIPISLTESQKKDIRMQLSYKDTHKPDIYQIENSIIELSDNINITRNKIRQDIVSGLTKALSISNSDLSIAYKCIEALIAEIKSKQINDDYINSLLTDLEGQVLEALQDKDAFNKWGKDYLPSLLQAHMLQQCNNFKDPGVQHYGGELFTKIRDKADQIFCDLPPPKSSYNTGLSQPTSMAVFSQSSGSCFDGICDVSLHDGTFKKVKNISKGDIVLTPNGNSPVICVTKTMCKDNTTKMVTLDGGLIITPYHPIRINGIWTFPNDCGSTKTRHSPIIYNFVLENDHIMIINGIECVTLGHNYNTNSVISHPYYGSQDVINDLQKSNTWHLGEVMIRPDDTERDSTNIVCKINCE
jgi:hypothetical protein